MIHLDVGHKRGSYFNFTLAFLTSLMFDSSMLLVRQLIGQVYLALGWGTLVHVKFLNDSDCSTMHKWEGASLQGRHPHITGIWV